MGRRVQRCSESCKDKVSRKAWCCMVSMMRIYLKGKRGIAPGVAVSSGRTVCAATGDWRRFGPRALGLGMRSETKNKEPTDAKTEMSMAGWRCRPQNIVPEKLACCNDARRPAHTATTTQAITEQGSRAFLLYHNTEKALGGSLLTMMCEKRTRKGVLKRRSFGMFCRSRDVSVVALAKISVIESAKNTTTPFAPNKQT